MYVSLSYITPYINIQEPLLLTWFNYNPSMDKKSCTL